MRHPRHVARTVIAAIFCALSLVAAAPAAAQTGRVGGIVKDEAGQTIKGATITAENSNIGQSFTATTDDKGRFIMIGLRTGQWRFIAQAPGFAPQGGELPVRMGAPNPPLTFELKRSGVTQFGALAGITAKDLQQDLGSADALFNQKRWDEAIVAYRAIMAKAPALSVINLQIASAYRNKKDFDAAIAAYGDLLKLDPDNEKAKVGIGLANLERGNGKAAEEMLMKAAENPTAGRDVFYNLGEVKFTSGETDEAIKWYEKAGAADPAWGKPLYKLGLCALKKGDSAAAANLMDRVIAVDPVSPEAALARTTLDTLKK